MEEVSEHQSGIPREVVTPVFREDLEPPGTLVRRTDRVNPRGLMEHQAFPLWGPSEMLSNTKSRIRPPLSPQVVRDRSLPIFLLFQKDAHPFPALRLCTGHSLCPGLPSPGVPSSQHLLRTSLTTHLRWPLPIVPYFSSLLASFIESHHNLIL